MFLDFGVRVLEVLELGGLVFWFFEGVGWGLVFSEELLDAGDLVLVDDFHSMIFIPPND